MGVSEHPTPFYEFSREQRVAMTEAAISGRSTVMARWSALDVAEASPWSLRAEIAAALLADQASVADFGCATMTLEKLLRPDQLYVPIDVVARDARTMVCDFNREPPPPTAANAAACLGLIEYLHAPDVFLARLREHYRVAVVSYCVTDAPQAPSNRREHAWVNDFDTAGIGNLVVGAGWRIEESREVDAIQRIWRLG